MRLLERLGREAADPIDELLARALQYQRAEGGSLQGFLRWFEAGGGEIKRDLDQNRRREVRILDGARVEGPAGADRLPARHDARAARCRAAAGRRGWRGARCGCRAPTTPTTRRAPGAPSARERALEEQNRLLYVAMTRAEDRLYVGGWVGAKKPDRGCWYERIEAGLRASSDAGDLHRSPRAARPRRAASSSTSPTQLGDEGWTGDGYELTNAGNIEMPEQAELPLEVGGQA